MKRALLIVLLGCNANDGGASTGGTRQVPTLHKGSAGGFTAQLGADLGVGSGESKLGSASAPPAPAPPPGAPPVNTQLQPPPATGGSTGSGSSVASPPQPVVATGTAPSAGSGAAASQGQPPAPPTKRGPVHVPPELAAIKLDLEPNWDRDYDEAGTFSFVLKIPSSANTRTFYFHYGFDDQKAPSGCDDYQKWFADTRHFTVSVARQRGGSCYVEGTDDKGVPSFRYHVLYGGKPLTCWGSQYKDAADNPLGDLRDKVVMSGKKICETLAL